MSVDAETLRKLALIIMPAEALREVLLVVADMHIALSTRKVKDRDRKRLERASVQGQSLDSPRTVQGQTLPEVPPIDNHKPLPTLPDNSSLRSESSTSPNAPVDLLGETEKFSKSKANRTEAVETIRVAGEGWNAMAASLSLPAIDSIKPGSTREKHTLARARDLRTDHELDAAAGFAKLFNLIRGSPYLRGEVNGFVATFDWIIKPSNFLKIMEGNYEIRQQKIAGYGQRDYRRTA